MNMTKRFLMELSSQYPDNLQLDKEILQIYNLFVLNRYFYKSKWVSLFVRLI